MVFQKINYLKFEYLRDLLIKHGLPENKLFKIHNPFQKIEKDYSDTENPLPYFCWAGKMSHRKGLIYLLKAFAKVTKHSNDVKLYLIGEGNGYKEKLVRISTKLGIANQVIFTGWLKSEDVIKLFGNSIGVILPSIYPENLPTIILEAMGCKRPAIATNVGGTSEIIKDGHNGMLVAPYDSEALAEKMIYLLDNSTEFKKMGENALATVKQKFNPEVIADEYIKIYTNLLSRR